jgi:Four helical bundle domain
VSVCPVLQVVLVALKESIAANSSVALDASDDATLRYVSAMAAQLIDAKDFSNGAWAREVRPEPRIGRQLDALREAAAAWFG